MIKFPSWIWGFRLKIVWLSWICGTLIIKIIGFLNVTINSFVNVLCLIHIKLYVVSKSVCVFESPQSLICGLLSRLSWLKWAHYSLSTLMKTKIIFIHIKMQSHCQGLDLKIKNKVKFLISKTLLMLQNVQKQLGRCRASESESEK